MSEPFWVPIGGSPGPTGPQGPQGNVGPEGPSGTPVPAGTGALWFSNTPPTGWAILNGATITNAQTLNTELWANVDPSWKSGANIVLPDMRGRVPVGTGTHADVNALAKSEGIATVAYRRPKHATPVYTTPGGGGGASASLQMLLSGNQQPQVRYIPADSNTFSGATDGIPNSTVDPVGTPAYLVVNFIIKL